MPRSKVIASGWRSQLRTVLVFSFLITAIVCPAGAFDVGVGSQGNRLYIVVWNQDAAGTLEAVEIGVSAAPFTSTPVPVFVPGSVPPGSGAIAGFEFSVDSGAHLDAAGMMRVDVTGTVGSSARSASYQLELVARSSAPSSSGLVGGTTGIPGLDEVDSDGDGSADHFEIAAGSDPFDSSSLPPAAEPTAEVPSLPPRSTLLLALFFATTAWVILRKLPRRGRPV